MIAINVHNPFRLQITKDDFIPIPDDVQDEDFKPKERLRNGGIGRRRNYRLHQTRKTSLTVGDNDSDDDELFDGVPASVPVNLKNNGAPGGTINPFSRWLNDRKSTYTRDFGTFIGRFRPHAHGISGLVRTTTNAFIEVSSALVF